MQNTISKFVVFLLICTEASAQSMINSQADYEYTQTDDCLGDEFFCADENKCILINKRCDGVSDCDDNSDEVNCTAVNATQSPIETTTPDYYNYYGGCEDDEFDCGDSLCISNSSVCDGEPDCPGSEDEKDCPTTQSPAQTITPDYYNYYGGCEDDEFDCGDSLCISNSSVCDGEPDCPGSEDEKDCPTTQSPAQTITPDYYNYYGGCEDDEFDCGDSLCISNSSVCDGEPDCPGSEDEKDCPNPVTVETTTDSSYSYYGECESGEFECVDTGLCLPSVAVCDGVADCSDSSDEENCPASETTPAAMVHTTTQPSITCTYENVIYPAGAEILATNCTEIMCSPKGNVLVYENPACAGTTITPTMPYSTTITPTTPMNSQNITLWVNDFNGWRTALFTSWIPTVKRYINVVNVNDVDFSCPYFPEIICSNKQCVTFPAECLYCYCLVQYSDQLSFLQEAWENDVSFWKQTVSPVWEVLFKNYEKTIEP